MSVVPSTFDPKGKVIILDNEDEAPPHPPRISFDKKNRQEEQGIYLSQVQGS